MDSMLGSTKGGQFENSSQIQSISTGHFLFSLLLASFTNSLYKRPNMMVTSV